MAGSDTKRIVAKTRRVEYASSTNRAANEDKYQTQSALLLSALPRELRDEIWKLALDLHEADSLRWNRRHTTDCPMRHHRYSRFDVATGVLHRGGNGIIYAQKDQCGCPTAECMRKCNRRPHTNILSTCRQVYFEASRVLWRSKTLCFTSGAGLVQCIEDLRRMKSSIVLENLMSISMRGFESSQHGPLRWLLFEFPPKHLVKTLALLPTLTRLELPPGPACRSRELAQLPSLQKLIVTYGVSRDVTASAEESSKDAAWYDDGSPVSALCTFSRTFEISSKATDGERLGWETAIGSAVRDDEDLGLYAAILDWCWEGKYRPQHQGFEKCAEFTKEGPVTFLEDFQTAVGLQTREVQVFALVERKK